MKKLLFSLAFLLSFGLVLAGMFPQIISGKIVVPGYPNPDGLIVRQTNVRTGLSYDAAVDENGFFQVDWNNYPYLNGDKVAVTILACSPNPECVKYVNIEDGVSANLEFKIRADSPEGQQVVKEVYYVCADGKVVTQVESCEPVKPIVVEKPVVVQQYVCKDGTVVQQQYECLDDSSQVKQYAAAAGVGAVAAGFAGLVAYYVRKRKRDRAKKMLDTYIKKRKK